MLAVTMLSCHARLCCHTCRRKDSKATSQQHEADVNDLDDEEQFLNLDDVLEGKPYIL